MAGSRKVHGRRMRIYYIVCCERGQRSDLYRNWIKKPLPTYAPVDVLLQVINMYFKFLKTKKTEWFLLNLNFIRRVYCSV